MFHRIPQQLDGKYSRKVSMMGEGGWGGGWRVELHADADEVFLLLGFESSNEMSLTDMGTSRVTHQHQSQSGEREPSSTIIY